MLGKIHIKYRQRPDMTIAVDWDVKHQFKQKRACWLIDENLKHTGTCTSVLCLLERYTNAAFTLATIITT